MHITADALQEAIQQLEQAMHNHNQWVKRLERALVCRREGDDRDLKPDAHRQCAFGQWYYHGAAHAVRNLAGFGTIGVEHQRMHEMAAALLNTVAAGKNISPYAYDGFANALERLRLHVQSLKQELTELLFRRDPLTGAESRLNLLTELRKQRDLLKRGVQKACSIAMMDLDEFKKTNDSFGHVAGDKVLAACVSFVLAHVRPYDKLFRYGGEEFLLCLPGLAPGSAFDVIERIRMGIAVSSVAWKGMDIQVTASFGIAPLAREKPVELTLEGADRALYAAKAAGRNATKLTELSE